MTTHGDSTSVIAGVHVLTRKYRLKLVILSVHILESIFNTTPLEGISNKLKEVNIKRGSLIVDGGKDRTGLIMVSIASKR